tara:strand:+ start:1051 stop:1275 length:225 start_codon:yes stop_codon:yes gene_type:complete
MSKEEQEYIDNLKEAISEMIEDLEDIRDGIVKVSEAKGHVKAVKETCEVLRSTCRTFESDFKNDFYYYNFEKED